MASFAQGRLNIYSWSISVMLWKSTRPTVPQAEDKFGEPSPTSPKSNQVWQAGTRVGLHFQEGKMLSDTQLAGYPEQGTAWPRGGIGPPGCVLPGTGGVLSRLGTHGPGWPPTAPYRLCPSRWPHSGWANCHPRSNVAISASGMYHAHPTGLAWAA